MVRRWRRLLVVIVMMIVPMVLLRSLPLDHSGTAPGKDQHSRAGQKKSC
jgi:hypothetical protein